MLFSNSFNRGVLLYKERDRFKNSCLSPEVYVRGLRERYRTFKDQIKENMGKQTYTKSENWQPKESTNAFTMKAAINTTH